MTVSRRVRTCMWGISIAAVMLTLMSSVYASGFAVLERSGEGLGQAFSGATAGYSDGSAAYFNPAAMPWTGGQTLSIGVHTIIPQADFVNRSSGYVGGSMPMPDVDGGDGGIIAYVPNVYYVGPAMGDFTVGLAINSPFGLATEWRDGWTGRYHALKTDLLTVNIGPAIAWQPHERLSLGASVTAMYLDAELSNAINIGAVAASMGIAGFAPGSADGVGTLTGDDWAYGFSLGLVYAICDNSRIGIHYRSEVESTLSGDAVFEVPVPLQPSFAAMNTFVNTAGAVELTLPQQASIGYVHALGEEVEVSFELGWTGWSSFRELRVDFASSQPDSVTDESWEDTWNVALGLSYQLNDAVCLRTGIAYDETPIPDATHRTPRIPDNDRLWTAIGCGIQATDNLSLEVGYAHIFVDDAETLAMTATGDLLAGTFESAVDIVSIEGVLRF